MEAFIPKTDPAVIEKMVDLGIPLINPQKAIAERLRDNNHLRDFLKAIDAENRLKVYEALTPHLKFKAKPYWWLMAGRKKRAS